MQTRPSRLYLPKWDGSPRTIFEYILARFPQVQPTVWRMRIMQGEVCLSDGSAVGFDTAYRHGVTVFYRREVASEPAPLEKPLVIYQDESILVVDKPHGMPVTPSGEHVERSLLVIVQRSTGFRELSPVHRLDRDTAGLVLFTIGAETRAAYHRLFVERRVEREYVAVAHTNDSLRQAQWRIENRINSGDPWYRQQIADGVVNAVTDIELLGVRRGFAEFRLLPQTGRKHQLRVHMASIGCPIVGDPFYPVIRARQEGDFPMQLLARQLAFTDPLTGASHTFISKRILATLS